MPDRNQVLVTNTTPLIALTAATGNLDVQGRAVELQSFLRNSLDRGERDHGIWLSEQVVKFALSHGH